MSSFQSQLDSELEKRGLTNADASTKKKGNSKKDKKAKKKKRKKENKPLPISFKSFFVALVLGCFIFTGLIGWAWFNADQTSEDLKNSLPTKTAIVNRETSVTIEDVQPVLRMQPVEVEETQKNQDSEATPATKKDEQIKAQPLLIENTKFGALPIIDPETGATPFNTYKKQTSLDPQKPSIAFIITNMGVNNTQTEMLIKDLPEAISFAFSPYAANIKTKLNLASQDGHETWMMLPLETKNFPLQDPGPLAILSGGNVAQNETRMMTLLGKAMGYVGLIAEKNHKFNAEDALTNPAFKMIFDRGLAVIDGNTQGFNFVERLAQKEGLPHGQNNFWLDDDLLPLALNQRLRQSLQYARDTGGVTVMLRPYPASIETLNRFLNSVAVNDFNIVPASSLVRHDG